MAKQIAVDAMGGDFAPFNIVKGAFLAAKQGVSVVLFGRGKELIAILNELCSTWNDLPISVRDCKDEITMSEDPVDAIRKKSQSSLVLAVKSVAEGSCNAIVSAGNSGAVMAASIFCLGRLPSVLRPAIVGFMPSCKRPVIVLDLGANVDCRPEHLVQFAHIGFKYAQDACGYSKVKIGLLSNGHERTKGSHLIKTTFAELEKMDLPFHGNVEPKDIFAGTTEVVVCDGFVGNILLKTMEAVYAFYKQDIKGKGIDQNTLLENGIGGALLLGVKAPVVICHGNAQSRDIEQAIIFANRQ